MARATNDLKAIAMTAGFGILTLVDSSLYMLTIVFMMGFTISWEHICGTYTASNYGVCDEYIWKEIA